MTTKPVLQMAEEVWTDGLVPMEGLLLTGASSGLTEILDGVALVPSFGNVMPIKTDEGMVLVDTSMSFMAPANFAAIRAWTDAPLDTAIYTHGHVDHACGMGPFDEEAEAKRAPRPRVVAHEAVLARFSRYASTAGYNAAINERQFGATGLAWPTQFRLPDVTHRDGMNLTVGGRTLELRHARGETDDHTWVFLPDERVLYPGDLFIWCVPNAGNPSKVQRYAGDWAAALREMLARRPEVMIPSHGLPVVGADRVATVLGDTAELLESLVAQTREMMNAGCRLNEIIHTVAVPAHLEDKPWLQPIYDEPEFIVRNIWRLDGGWYGGDPDQLHPAPTAQLAQEIASLSGGAGALADRAAALAVEGDLRVAGHLVELAARAAPDDASIAAIRADVNQRRAEQATSLMARGVYAAAVRESRATASGA